MTTNRFATLALMFGAVAIGAACGGHTEAAPPDVALLEKPQPGVFTVDPAMLSSITVATLAERESAGTLAIAGKVQFDEDRLARVLTPLSGQVVELRVKVGDAAHKGERLCAISSRDAAAAIDEEIESRRDLELAEKNAAMTQDLFDHEAASRIALQQAQNDLAKARARVDRTGEALKVLGLSGRDDLAPGAVGWGRVPIPSPITGVVIDRKVTEGQFVQSDSTPLLTVANLDAVWVIGEVFERDLRFVTTGQPAVVTASAYPGEQFQGRVNYISDSIDPTTRTAKVRVSVANPGARLKPEMFAAVELHGARRQHALTVPSAAVFTEDGHSYVYVEAGPARFERRAVEIESGDAPDRHVSFGLSPGDRVVVAGALLLRQEEQQRAS